MDQSWSILWARYSGPWIEESTKALKRWFFLFRATFLIAWLQGATQCKCLMFLWNHNTHVDMKVWDTMISTDYLKSMSRLLYTDLLNTSKTPNQKNRKKIVFAQIGDMMAMCQRRRGGLSYFNTWTKGFEGTWWKGVSKVADARLGRTLGGLMLSLITSAIHWTFCKGGSWCTR